MDDGAVMTLRTNNTTSNGLNDHTWWWMHHHSVFYVHPSHSLYNKFLLCLQVSVPTEYVLNSACPATFSTKIFQLQIESESAIIILDVRGDSSWVLAMHLRTLQDCQLMSAHWLILHSGKESLLLYPFLCKIKTHSCHGNLQRRKKGS